MDKISNKVIALLQLARKDPALVDRISTIMAEEKRVDALLAFSAQNAIAIDCTEITAGCEALIKANIPFLSDEDLQEINGGLIGQNMAEEMACMVFKEQAFNAKIREMRSRGCSKELIDRYAFVYNNPGRKVVFDFNS
ncbi:hypothetical protein KTQ42_02495|uniref:hypothetical protein n=1 Tax=Noviherbaspirillum sp. L7-7A TaxID=2850560 RepID=UPI001C2BC783|nr:hypothetical protein [Noviherbaspirillum sp. L7-7A]MBV0878173.1 hypothetical protein [Noviherbaspirillum sp. L7-7A]